MSPAFSRFDHTDVSDLIGQYPLAWIVSDKLGAIDACNLPLVGKFDDGQLTSLIGHMSKSNPLNAAFCDQPSGAILFSGPNGYVSPEYAGRRDWGATWNYANLRLRVDVTMDESLTDHALDILLAKCETGRAAPWRPEELGERRQAMRERIIGFEARVISLCGTFKLGQDEDPRTFECIVEHHPDDALREWMVRMREGHK